MAESRPQTKASLPTPSARITSGVPRRDWRGYDVGDRVPAIESELSSDTVVSDSELDAIARLLGDELEKLLSNNPWVQR
jgi:hypothetical protein